VWDDAVVVDLSDRRGVRVDPASRAVRVDGGATWSAVDHATHAFGLAIPCGIVASTGVGGLTLGGGLGNLTRTHGLTIDSLISADVVLADGSFVTASAEEHPDLFWALRGGGGNFGVVTSFEFRAHPVRTVCAGPMFWELDRLEEIIRAWDELITRAPDELNGWFGVFAVAPADPFPAALHGKTVCAVVWCSTASPEHTDELLAPMRARGPVFDGVAEMPLPALNGAFDPLYPKGDQWYWRADFVDELTDEAITAHAEHARRLPTGQSAMHLYPISGAVHRVRPDETAWRYRRSRYGQVIVGVDPDPANADAITRWTQDYHDALHPYAAGGAYVNMMMHDEGDDRVRASYGANYDRLAAVKRRYDPGNLFRINQNIKP
jgi:FAD/FMN-containing dehydrogenase